MCGEPLCCRKVNGLANGTRAAGKWGDYQCDLNLNLLDNLLSHFSQLSPRPDAVFWTGFVLFFYLFIIIILELIKSLQR